MEIPQLIDLSIWDAIYITIFLVNLVIIIYIVFVQRRHPSQVIPWIMIIVFLPVLGFILYLIFGFNYFSEKQFRLKSETERVFVHKLLERQGREMEQAMGTEEKSEVMLARLLLKSGDAPVLRSAQVRMFNEGKEKFEALFEAIEGAQHHIHIEYYILRNDELGRQLVDLLTQKAREGVEVRLLLDRLGNKIPKKGYREFEAAGARMAIFFKPRIPFLSLRFNYHNHRKIAVIDGQIGFVGGFNIGTEYLGEGPLGPWRDCAAELGGEAVAALQARFILDWNYATKEGLGVEEGPYFPLKASGEGTPVQVVSSGPDSAFTTIKDGYLKLLGVARRYIYIQTPYFIPDESIMDALKTASLSGVDVRIIFPDKPDPPFVYWASLSFVGQLLPWGVRAYTFDDGFIHAKTAFVDDQISSIGSANWDIRSFRLNFETNAFIYDSAVARQGREWFEKDLERCTEIVLEDYRKRPTTTHIKESISRLLSPIL